MRHPLLTHEMKPRLSALDIKKVEDEVDDVEDMNTFKVYTSVSCKLANTWPKKTKCPGCSKTFPAKSKYVYHPTFYQHCIKECVEYRKLGRDNLQLI